MHYIGNKRIKNLFTIRKTRIYTLLQQKKRYRYVTIEIHLTISNLKKVCLKMALSYYKYGISRSSRGRAFHNLGAATWNDLSPSVALVLNVGDASKIPPHDLG